MKSVSYFATYIPFFILVHCVISSLATVTSTNDPINVVCPDGYDGLLPYPYDCHYFISVLSTLHLQFYNGAHMCSISFL